MTTVTDRPFFVHPSAFVDEPVSIGPGSKIWHFSHVSAGAVLGKECNIGQNVFVAPGVRLGDHVKVQNNVSLYDGVTLEDYVFCGPSCVFTNVDNPRAEIDRRGQYLATLVRRGASIGANATIVCGTTIGRYAFVAAGAVVTRGNVPDYALVAGVPAKQTGWMSRHGHRLGAPGADRVLRCPQSNWRYREREAGVMVCLDKAEEEAL